MATEFNELRLVVASPLPKISKNVYQSCSSQMVMMGLRLTDIEIHL